MCGLYWLALICSTLEQVSLSQKKVCQVSGSDVAVAVLVSSSGRQMLALSGVSVASGVSLGCSYWFA